MTPFVVTASHFCDPDAKTSTVGSTKLLPVDLTERHQ